MDISPMNIPLEMRQHPAWVCWDYRVRHGKMTKVPLQPNGSPASSTNSTTWHTFEACYATVFRHSGIGIVLAHGLAGIDLDHHIDEYGHMSDVACQLVDRLNTYTEITPSSHGLHLLFRGTLPDGGRRRDQVGFEWYDCRRFFTVTGRHVPGTPTTLASQDQLLLTIQAEIFGEPTRREPQPCSLMIPNDADLLQRAMTARNGDRFSALWKGDVTPYAGDHSRADLALCRMLAFWTSGDAARVDQLFRQSGLMRDKWAERHYADGQTYGEATIAKAVRRFNGIPNART